MPTRQFPSSAAHGLLIGRSSLLPILEQDRRLFPADRKFTDQLLLRTSLSHVLNLKIGGAYLTGWFCRVPDTPPGGNPRMQ